MVPQAARDVAAAVGVLLVATSAASVIGTLIVPRPVTNWLTRQIDHVVRSAFILITKFIPDYRRRDRVLSAHAAALLIAQIVAWLLMFFVGFSLIFYLADGERRHHRRVPHRGASACGRSARTPRAAGSSRRSSTSRRSPASSR